MFRPNSEVVVKKEHFLSNGEQINVLIYKPKQGTQFPSIIFHPGNRIYPEDYVWLHIKLVQLGYVVMAIYQRGYGSGVDKVNDRAGIIQQNDLKNALQFLKTKEYVNQSRIGAIGHSNGAGLCLRLGAENNEIKCIVSMSMIADWGIFVQNVEHHLPEYYGYICEEFGGSPLENQKPYEERSCLGSANNIQTPVLILVGEDDNITPPYQSRMMYDVLKQHGREDIELDIIPDAGHFFERYSFSGYRTEEVAEKVAHWIKIHL